MNEKAVSKSISLPQDYWDKVEIARNLNKESQSGYFKRLASLDLRKIGLLGDSSEWDDLLSLIQEATEVGVPVYRLIKAEMQKEVVS